MRFEKELMETWALYFYGVSFMRYFTNKPEFSTHMYGETYVCNHPLYDRCTLYKVGSRGVCVVQQRFNESTKSTYWTEIDPWLNDIIYLKAGFKDFFDSHSEEERNGLYPTVTVRQLMWRLRMKPLKRERWETVIDRKTL